MPIISLQFSWYTNSKCQFCRLVIQLANKLQKTCRFHWVATSLSKTSPGPGSVRRLVKFRPIATLLFADLLELVKETCTKAVDNRFWQSTYNKSVHNLQQTCRSQAVASHANASGYRFVVRSLLQDVDRLGATCSFWAVHLITATKLLQGVSKKW